MLLKQDAHTIHTRIVIDQTRLAARPQAPLPTGSRKAG
jgi:hypothetical protein